MNTRISLRVGVWTIALCLASGVTIGAGPRTDVVVSGTHVLVRTYTDSETSTCNYAVAAQFADGSSSTRRAQTDPVTNGSPGAAADIDFGKPVTSASLSHWDCTVSSSSNSNLNLTGSWVGQYTYTDRRPGVPFQVSLNDNGGQISGRTTEPNTFGNPSAAQLFANVSGSSSGNQISFVKTYDGTGDQTHSVQYSGTVDPTSSTISGTWNVGSYRGQFLISRAR